MRNKRIAVLILTLLFSALMVISVSAEDALVIYRGNSGDIDFYPGSIYSDTDLFPNFKGVMPGDKLTQEISFLHTGLSQHYIKVYMRALGASVDWEFLSKLNLSVNSDSHTIFDAPANETGTLTNWTHIATLSKGEWADLLVTLTVPTDLDNHFQFREGHIDWQFKIEEFSKDYIPIKPSKKEDYIKYRVAANYYTDKNLDNPVPVPLYSNEKATELPSIDEIIELYSIYTKYGDNEYTYTSLDFDPMENAFTLNFERTTAPIVPDEPEYITYKIEAMYFTNGMLDGYIPVASLELLDKPEAEDIKEEYSSKYKQFGEFEYSFTAIEFDESTNTFTLRYDRTDTEIKPDAPELPTGDSTNLILWISLMTGSLLVIIILIIILSKKKKEEK